MPSTHLAMKYPMLVTLKTVNLYVFQNSILLHTEEVREKQAAPYSSSLAMRIYFVSGACKLHQLATKNRCTAWFLIAVYRNLIGGPCIALTSY